MRFGGLGFFATNQSQELIHFRKSVSNLLPSSSSSSSNSNSFALTTTSNSNKEESFRKSGGYEMGNLAPNNQHQQITSFDGSSSNHLKSQIFRDSSGFAMNDDEDDVYDFGSGNQQDFQFGMKNDQQRNRRDMMVVIEDEDDETDPFILSSSLHQPSNEIGGVSKVRSFKACLSDGKLPLKGFHMPTTNSKKQHLIHHLG